MGSGMGQGMRDLGYRLPKRWGSPEQLQVRCEVPLLAGAAPARLSWGRTLGGHLSPTAEAL